MMNDKVLYSVYSGFDHGMDVVEVELASEFVPNDDQPSPKENQHH